MREVGHQRQKPVDQLRLLLLLVGHKCPTSRITKWVDTTVDELYVFFAITLAMGVVVKTRLEEYWNCSQDIFVTPEFTTAMRYDRFLLLSRCILFRNNETCDPSTMSRAEAKLFKVQPIIDHLNHKFSTL
ncbi:hypothetical protein ABMA28_009258 [Loxostege sticticalis]|uniref:PiggyBac transposable element-derived protein domain-containing protein n=1 Tax=Loxostege sticticalis TaxID=481309 RepID=A0ABD0SCQ1_LOXSC